MSVCYSVLLVLDAIYYQKGQAIIECSSRSVLALQDARLQLLFAYTQKKRSERKRKGKGKGREGEEGEERRTHMQYWPFSYPFSLPFPSSLPPSSFTYGVCRRERAATGC